MAPEPLVRAASLGFAYESGEARRQVLTGISLALHPGELVIMTGPSGSGKTTLLGLIGALRRMQEGSLQVFGRELAGLSAQGLLEYRQQLGFIFQHHNLFPALTAVQSVRMALDLQGPRADHDVRARAILDRLGLGDRTDHKPDRLSGGQRQRVAIARALVHEPRLILADEPTAALDQQRGRDTVDLIRERVRESGAAALMVTHDSRLLDAADRLVNMVDGRVVSDIAVTQMVDLCGYLRASKLFAERTNAELMEVAQKMTRHEYAAGQAIVRQGEAGDRFYIVWSGTMDVDIEQGGTVIRRPPIERGGYFGERALIAQEPRSATVRARGPAEVYALGKEDFMAALSHSRTFRDELLSLIFSRT
jgi:putative ABC transport system ATP-binding protein